MIKNRNFSDELEVRTLCDLACNIRNLPKGALTTDIPEICKSQKQKYVLPRAVISNIARLHARIHPDVIADVLGKDRTTILAYRTIHKNQYETWGDYNHLFSKMLKGYNDIRKSKTSFKDPDELYNHLSLSGFIFSSSPQGYISINTPLFTTCINTSLEDCGDNMEIIRLALLDYEIDSIKLKINEKFTK